MKSLDNDSQNSVTVSVIATELIPLAVGLNIIRF